MLAEEWYATEGEGGRLVKNITLVMLDLLKLSRQTSIWPERDVIKYIRSAIAIDGLITRFAPTFNVGQYLEMICNRYLQWYAYHELVTFDSILEWSRANSQLFQDGILRAYTLFSRLNADNISSPLPLQTTTEDSSVQYQSILLALMIFAISLLIVITGEEMRFGINTFTVEVILLVAASFSLLRRLPRLI